MRKYFAFLYPFIFSFLCACVGEKQSRALKRDSRIIRKSEIILKATRLSTVSYVTFNLRNNRFFDINCNSMFMWDYYAGTWEERNDTFYLHFINNHKYHNKLNYIIVDPTKNFINIPINDSTYKLRLNIILNNLSKKEK